MSHSIWWKFTVAILGLSIGFPAYSGGPLLPRLPVKIPIETLRVMNAERFLALRNEQLAWDVQIGALTVQVPVELQQRYPLGVREFTQKARMSELYFPSISLVNDGKVARSLQGFADNAARFAKHQNAILSNLQSEVYPGKVPYRQLLPPAENIDYLYIGEVHDQPSVQTEIVQFIKQLPSMYPNRSIYVATEFLPEEPFGEETKFTEDYHRNVPLFFVDQDRLKQVLPQEVALYQDLSSILADGIPLVGLEPQVRMFEKILVETKHVNESEVWEHISDWYDEFSVSEEGMAYRNRIWAEHLAQLRAQDPSALIVVYAGAAHVGYQSVFSLPRLVNRPKQFVTFFTTPSYIPHLNPLFDGLREDPALQRAFGQSRRAKMVTRWKQESPLKKIMGTDLTVIVHK